MGDIRLLRLRQHFIASYCFLSFYFRLKLFILYISKFLYLSVKQLVLFVLGDLIYLLPCILKTHNSIF